MSESFLASGVQWGTLYEPPVGISINMAAEKMVAEAKLTGHRVYFRFNGTDVSAGPKTTVEQVIRTYELAREMKG